jgi:hypothetical protein
MYAIENKENNDIQALHEQLEKQYGPAVAQDIIDRMPKNGPVAKTPDYMDVKAMSELAERFRAQAMMAVWRLREWRNKQTKPACQRNLIQLEGAFLQRQCDDAIKLYRQAHKTYFAMYHEAMASFTAGTAYNYIASQQAAGDAA